MPPATPMAGENGYAFSRRDRLKQLRAFCYAARHLSISRAAERIFLSQPAVSHQIRTLEEELEVTLFDRHGARIALTPAGERFYQAARPLVERLDRLRVTFTEGYRGVSSADLNIAAGQAASVTVLPKFLKRFKVQHPRIRVNLSVADGQESLRSLMNYDVDLVVAAVDVTPPEAEFRPLLSSEMVFITPEHHPLAGRTSVELAEITAYPTVAPPSSNYIGRVADVLLRQQGHVVEPALEVGGWLVIKQYVEAGVGIALVPSICVTEGDRVWSIPASRYFPSRNYGILTRRDDARTLAVEWFLRTVDEMRSRDT